MNNMSRQYSHDERPTIDEILDAAGAATVRGLVRAGGGASLGDQKDYLEWKIGVKLAKRGLPAGPEGEALRRVVFPARIRPGVLKH